MIPQLPSEHLPLGAPIPPDSEHHVSVSLPTFECVYGFFNDDEEVVNALQGRGYPRFFFQPNVKALMAELEATFGRESEKCLVFSTHGMLSSFLTFMESKIDGEDVTAEQVGSIRSMQFAVVNSSTEESWPITAIFLPSDIFLVAKRFNTLSGLLVSSRLAGYLSGAFEKNADQSKQGPYLLQQVQTKENQQPNVNYQSQLSIPSAITSDGEDGSQGGAPIYTKLQTSISSMINESLVNCSDDLKSYSKTRGQVPVDCSNVYLYPSGMGAIYNAHQAFLHLQPKADDTNSRKSICFGFPFRDTLSVLTEFGPGLHFLGFGDDKSLDQLEEQIDSGEISVVALMCECPSNPLLKTPNLKRIRALADKHGFPVIVDDTIGNFTNINTLPFADVVVTSLTKLFSGVCEVMGGSLVLNPSSKYFDRLKDYFTKTFEQSLWVDDAAVIEKCGRDFKDRSQRVNANALAVSKLLEKSDLTARVYYPALSESVGNYDYVKTKDGGYGCLLSVLFKDAKVGHAFYSNLKIYKGPSLGCNFTLSCPFPLLAHFRELDEVAEWGVDGNLIRISVGFEDQKELLQEFSRALEAAGSSYSW